MPLNRYRKRLARGMDWTAELDEGGVLHVSVTKRPSLSEVRAQSPPPTSVAWAEAPASPPHRLPPEGGECRRLVVMDRDEPAEAADVGPEAHCGVHRADPH